MPWWRPRGAPIGAEQAIPPIDENAEIVPAHVLHMVQVMNRARHPENQIGVGVLQLMRVGREHGIEQHAGHPAQSGRQRDEQDRPAHHDGRHAVVHQVMRKGPRLIALVMPAMPPPVEETPVHQPVDRVFDERGEDEGSSHRGEKRGEVPGDAHASDPRVESAERPTRAD